MPSSRNAMMPAAGMVTQWQASHRENGRNASHITRKRDVCLHARIPFIIKHSHASPLYYATEGDQFVHDDLEFSFPKIDTIGENADLV